MADNGPAIQPLRSEKIFARITQGQYQAIREYAEEQGWVDPDGRTNTSAVIRHLLAEKIPGFNQM